MAVVLQLQDAYELLRAALEDVDGYLRRLAGEHADTPMIGRTHYMHALPITFGLKVGSWLDEVDRHIDRCEDLEG